MDERQAQTMCQKRPAYIKRDQQKRPWKETNTRDWQKRLKETCKKDLHKRRSDSQIQKWERGVEASVSANKSANNLLKETCIHRKRPLKETYKRVLKTWWLRDINEDEGEGFGDARAFLSANNFVKRPVYIKRDLHKRPTKETCKSDRKKRRSDSQIRQWGRGFR